MLCRRKGVALFILVVMIPKYVPYLPCMLCSEMDPRVPSSGPSLQLSKVLATTHRLLRGRNIARQDYTRHQLATCNFHRSSRSLHAARSALKAAIPLVRIEPSKRRPLAARNAHAVPHPSRILFRLPHLNQVYPIPGPHSRPVSRPHKS